MRHPTDGILRRLVDEPAGVAQADREHVAGCPACLAGLAAAQQDAAVTGAALHVAPAVDVDAGWERLSRAVSGESQAVSGEGSRRGPATAAGRRWHTALRSPVIAVVGVVALLAGAGAAAAADWLPIFRAEKIAPVTAPEADLVKLPDLSAFGEVQVTEKISLRGVDDAAEAEKITGLSVPQMGALPRGVSGEPTYRVGARANAVFTYSAEKAAQTAAAAGQTLPPPPAGLDGTRFRLSAGPGYAAIWSQGRPVPALVVARAVAPTAYSSGVPFETARDYLLSLPLLPENVASQLRTFSADGTTLPLFMAVEEMTSSTADVNGRPATVLASRDGVMAAVVWVDDGVVTAVAGSLSADEVLGVARGMRWSR
ncbi:hypothetical protein [Couchioplanes caeruleus]|uniref:Uncharacterized protein n=2 Tax=Couchioplanes caeruleus TaxID=56438 RepID=A0A1K0FF16_9ACTN|nr:hypothetical protein [Couchioplanes caeruleus]OJF11425.1 hypothetical protein BG844_26415 [Couchioplanes caeruleus subsp. caeruleus]ROP28872.1 hypothetical protein EDD30_1650 [Couchioplanes caeruleus]